MCTVVITVTPGGPVRILALRDELTSREFDLPGTWWPEQPGVVGGRDRLAGGSWCVSDVTAGATAIVVNRTERRTGTPSRGVLPLLALATGRAWPEHADVSAMASFLLLLAGPAGATLWSFDGAALTAAELEPGTHMLTSAGLDAANARTERHLPSFQAQSDWPAVVRRERPSAATSTLLVTHTVGAATYATVFGQLITATPGALRVEHSRTPWLPGWQNGRWPSTT